MPKRKASPIEAEGTVLILSQTRSKMPEDRFLPEREIWDEKILRADYEKLRMAHELYRDLGVALHSSEFSSGSSSAPLSCSTAIAPSS